MPGKFKTESAEPLWPKQILVLVPVGFLVGLILGQSHFDDPNPLRSGWTWLAVFAAILLTIAWSAWRAQYRVARQIRLGILLSLMAHVGLLFAMESISLGISASGDWQLTPWNRRDVEQQVFLGEPKIEVIPRQQVQPPVDVESLKEAVIERSPRQEQPAMEPPTETPLPPLPPTIPPATIPPATIARVEPATLDRVNQERPLPLAADETPVLRRATAQAPTQTTAAVDVPAAAAPAAQAAAQPTNALDAQPAATERQPLAIGSGALQLGGTPAIGSSPAIGRPERRGDGPQSAAAAPLATVPLAPVPRQRSAGIPTPGGGTLAQVPDVIGAGPASQPAQLAGSAPTGGGGAASAGPAVSSGRLTGTGTGLGIVLPGASGAGDGTALLAGGAAPSRRSDTGTGVATVTHLQDDRFLNRRAGGLPEINIPVRDRAEAFRGRRPLGRAPGVAGPAQAGSKAEDAIRSGLEFLTRYQLPDGRWSLHSFRGATEADAGLVHSDAAATGLSLLSFLGAGYDHYDDKYQTTVRGGLDFLLKNQKPNGDLYIPQDAESNKSAWLYSHAIATLALCESYGMTGDKKLREPAQRAINFIVETQNQSTGGWRYTPGVSADTSVSGWQLMALKSGELAGLKVPKVTLDKIRAWLDYAQVEGSGGSQYLYNPGRPASQDPRDARRPTMTSVGLLMRFYLGWNRQTPAMMAGANTLQASLPEMGARGAWTRDTYYWYYATQVMYHMGGNYWKTWNERLDPLLVSTQVQSGDARGSWDPINPVPDRWGQHGGRIYVTTLNLLSLEVTYRNLPIYDVTQK